MSWRVLQTSTIRSSKPRLDVVVRNAINEGLPLNTVIGSDVYFSMNQVARRKLKETILLVSACWLEGDKAEAKAA